MNQRVKDLPIVYFYKDGNLVWMYAGFKDIEAVRQYIKE